MSIKYAHTNIISSDWKTLTHFYINVFDCEPVPPQRNQSGTWLEKGTGVKNAHLQGMHLRLPGLGNNGPTLEIFSYDKMLEKSMPVAANRKGITHLAFEVDNVQDILQKIIAFGGNELGKIVVKKIEGVGTITFTYATDPEGNILEIQSWVKG